MTIYLNMKTSHGIETVDEFTRQTEQTPKEFRAYLSKMVNEYHIAGMNVYKSSRPTRDWYKKEPLTY